MSDNLKFWSSGIISNIDSVYILNKKCLSVLRIDIE